MDPELRHRVLTALGALNGRHGTHDQKSHGRKGPKAAVKAAAKKAVSATKKAVEATDKAQADKPPATAKRADRLAPKLDKSVASGVKSRRKAPSAASQIEVVTFKDGGRAIRKKFTSNGDGPAKDKADSAELVSNLARTLGVAAPEIHRISQSEIYAEFIDGPDAYDDPRMTAENIERLAKSGQGRILGLVDLLTDYDDRNARQNWAYDNGYIVPLDNDSAWSLSKDPAKPPAKHAVSPFSAQFVAGKSWAANDLTGAEIDEVRRRLESLRPKFSKLGRAAWLDFSLARLDAIAAHAAGS